MHFGITEKPTTAYPYNAGIISKVSEETWLHSHRKHLHRF